MLLPIIAKELRANRFSTAIAIFSLALATTLLSLVAAVVFTGYREISSRLFTELPEDMVLVEPKHNESLLLHVFSQGKSRGGISEGRLKKLSSLPGVLKAYPRLDIKVPMMASGGGGIFGSELSTELFASGLPPELLAESAEEREKLKPQDGLVPVVISPDLLNLYNQTVAPALNAPPLSITALKGISFELTLGRSYMLRGSGQVGRERCTIAGASKLATTLGFSVPLDVAYGWMKSYAPQEKIVYSGVYLKLAPGYSKRALQKEVEEMGLFFDRDSQRAAELFYIIIMILTIFGASLLLLSLLAIFEAVNHIAVSRREAFGVMAALGATPRQLRAILLGEALFIGLAGGFIGIFISRLLIGIGNLILPLWGKGFWPATGLNLPFISLLTFWAAALLTALLAALPVALKNRKHYERI